MERSPSAEYRNIFDAQPTVNTGSPPTRLDELARPTRISQYELDPYSAHSERSGFLASSVQTLKNFPKGSKDLICSERINILLIFVPIGITVGFLEVDPIVDFVLNALAIIPLAVVISTATENVASRLGDTLGALLNVTVGNTAELMIFFVALAKNQIRIVQASLLGSILANLLLVLGTAFLVGGLRFANQLRDKPAAHTSVGLLDFGLLVSLFPVAFVVALSDTSTADVKQRVLNISRATSIGLIVIYLLYLAFQVKEQADDVSTKYEDEVVADEMGPLPMSTLSRNTSRPDACPSKSAWLPHLDQPNNRGREPTSSRANNVASASLLCATSLDDIDVASVDDDAIRVGTASRSRSTGAKTSRGYHTPHDSMESRGYASDGNASDEDHEDDSYRTYNNHMASVRPARVGLPPSPPSTPPTPRLSRSNLLESGQLPSVQERSSASPYADRRDSQTSSFPRRGFNRSNTLTELYAYKRHRTEQSQTPLPIAILVLVLATALVSVATEQAVDAIPPIVESWGVSQIFLGFIVLPSIGNASEHIIAAKMASNNKMVLAKKVAVESAAQVVLLIMPAVVLIGWAKGLEMSMKFDIYEIACIVMTSLVASILICRGKGDWKQGVLLHSIFLIVALGAVVYPTKAQLYGQR